MVKDRQLYLLFPGNGRFRYKLRIQFQRQCLPYGMPISVTTVSQLQANLA